MKISQQWPLLIDSNVDEVGGTLRQGAWLTVTKSRRPAHAAAAFEPSLFSFFVVIVITIVVVVVVVWYGESESHQRPPRAPNQRAYIPTTTASGSHVVPPPLFSSSRFFRCCWWWSRHRGHWLCAVRRGEVVRGKVGVRVVQATGLRDLRVDGSVLKRRRRRRRVTKTHHRIHFHQPLQPLRHRMADGRRTQQRAEQGRGRGRGRGRQRGRCRQGACHLGAPSSRKRGSRSHRGRVHVFEV
mmetsp:Transcript_50374/g.86287  ORF Transcript_50374/g.86287 Transcript_50374/m.86287 type:complete len:241 (-) Transcript_50374:201-923(-)